MYLFVAILLCCGVSAPCAHACTFGDYMGQEDVTPKAHQASFNVSESKNNVQVVIPGVNNREWLTTSTSSALGL